MSLVDDSPYHRLYLIDTKLFTDEAVASYLLVSVSSGKAAIIETASSHNADTIMQELAKAAVNPEDISYIIVTHVHLDHAGGAGALMQKCPNAHLLCHERGARHMIDPTALIAGSTVVYGNEFMEKNYLPVIGIAKERVISVAPTEQRVKLGDGCEILLRQSPGHAPHHIQPFLYIADTTSGHTDATICQGLFTGDSFAAEYPVQRNRSRKASKVSFITPLFSFISSSCCLAIYSSMHSTTI